MELSEWIAISAGVVAIVVAFYAVYKSGAPLTLETAGEIVERAEPLSAKLDVYARSVVLAMQQLKADGKIDTGAQAMQHALAQMQTDFPDVDPQVLAVRIELAYRLVKPLLRSTSPANVAAYAQEGELRP